MAIGATVNNVDLNLVPVKTASVSGRVLDLEGRPLANPQINLVQHGPGIEQAVSFVVGRPDGGFALTGVPPGDYTVDATVVPSPATGGVGRATARAVVNGEDIKDLVLTPPRMSIGTRRPL